MTDPIIAVVDMPEGIEKIYPILIALENSFLLIPAGGDMVDRDGIFYSQRPGHNN